MSILYFVIIFYSNKLFIEIASLLVQKKLFKKHNGIKKFCLEKHTYV